MITFRLAKTERAPYVLLFSSKLTSLVLKISWVKILLQLWKTNRSDEKHWDRCGRANVVSAYCNRVLILHKEIVNVESRGERLLVYYGALYIKCFGNAKKFVPIKRLDRFNFRKKKLMEANS